MGCEESTYVAQTQPPTQMDAPLMSTVEELRKACEVAPIPNDRHSLSVHINPMHGAGYVHVNCKNCHALLKFAEWFQQAFKNENGYRGCEFRSNTRFGGVNYYELQCYAVVWGNGTMEVIDYILANLEYQLVSHSQSQSNGSYYFISRGSNENKYQLQVKEDKKEQQITTVISEGND